MSRIDISQDAPDRLSRDLWAFAVRTSPIPGETVLLVLTSWHRERRRSTRHKWMKEGEGYRERSHNGIIAHGGWRLPAAQVPLPDDVKRGALAALSSGLRMIGPVDPPDARR